MGASKPKAASCAWLRRMLASLSLSYLDMDILKTSDVFSFTASAVLKEPLLSAAGICNEAIGPGRHAHG